VWSTRQRLGPGMYGQVLLTGRSVTKVRNLISRCFRSGGLAHLTPATLIVLYWSPVVKGRRERRIDVEGQGGLSVRRASLSALEPG
jgi:hypothetical protein